MATTSQELELIGVSEKKYIPYVAVLLLVLSVLFYSLARFIPWHVDPPKMALSLAVLLALIIIERIIVPKKFAKFSLYFEIFATVGGIAFATYFSGGVISPFNASFIIPIVFALFLASVNAGWIVLGTSIAIMALFIFLPAGLPTPHILNRVSPFTFYTILLLYLTAIILLLRQLLVRLEAARKAAQERVTLLENITTRLQTLDRLKTEFVERTSHQLRTPLSELKWGFDALLSEDKGPLKPDQKTFIGTMSSSVQSLIQLVTQLLDISKIESEEARYVIEKADAMPLIKSIIDQYNLEIKRKHITLSLEPAEHVYVLGELKGLEVAIHNVIENAIQYTPENGAVNIFFGKDDHTLTIHVRDTGIGISKDEQKFLFTRFYRGPRAAHMVANGTGLGLAITKEIVEKLNGKIEIETEEGKGTEVKIVLPVPNEELK